MCLYPVRYVRAGRYHEHACGHCSECLRAYQDGWTARLNEELKSWRPVGLTLPVIFATFDYNPEAIPCTYLVVCSDGGYRLQDHRPACDVDPWWSTIDESPASWYERREQMLRRYYEAVTGNQPDARIVDRPNAFDKASANYSCEINRTTVYLSDGTQAAKNVVTWFEDFDLPEPFRLVTPPGELSHPVYTRPVLPAGPGAVPVYALEFHTVRKSDLQAVHKRARTSLARRWPDVFGQDVNPRLWSTWVDPYDGTTRDMPSSYLTATFKHFLTSEYGPQTFRPHYHAVYFGMTFEEFRDTIAADWERNFGHCDFSLYDPARGAITYLSKYCAKGSYDHPLACRDYIFESGKEYHSKDWDRCIQLFNINCPLVSPTFHLISKGIGAGYAFQGEIQRHLGVQLSRYLTDSNKVRYFSGDTDKYADLSPSLALDRLFVVNDNPADRSGLKLDWDCDGNVILTRLDYSRRGYILGRSVIKKESIINIAVEDLLAGSQYSRTYVKTKHNTPAACLQCWHLLGRSAPLRELHVQTYAMPLPRYYRSWLVSPLAQALRASSSKRLHPSLHEIETAVLELTGSPDQAAAARLSVLHAEEARREANASRLRSAPYRGAVRGRPKTSRIM